MDSSSGIILYVVACPVCKPLVRHLGDDAVVLSKKIFTQAKGDQLVILVNSSNIHSACT